MLPRRTLATLRVLPAAAALLLVVAGARAQDAVPSATTYSVPVHSTGTPKTLSDSPLVAPPPASTGPAKPLLVPDPEGHRRAKELLQQGALVYDPAADLVEDTAPADAP